MNISYLLAAVVPRDVPPDPRPIAIVLTTAERLEYLYQTCRSLEDAGADDRLRRIVLYQGIAAALPVPRSWEVYQTSGRLEGACSATLGALAIADLSQAPFLLLFEDDLVAEGRAVDLMIKTEVPADLAFLSFFDSRWLDRSDGRLNQILELRPNEGGPVHYGNLALKFPRPTLERFPELLETFEPTSPNEMDLQLPLLFANYLQGRYGLYCPSLVQHVGARSGITPRETLEGYGRTAKNFIGGLSLLSVRPPRVLCMETRPGKG